MFLTRLFYRPHYTSDATQFIEQLWQDHPGLQEAQRQGRARLWDRQQNNDLQRELDAGRIAQQPYVYIDATGKQDA